VSYAGAQQVMATVSTGGQCSAVRFDVRCQLQAGHEHTHIAMTRHVSSGRSGYRLWTDNGQSSWENYVGLQVWAHPVPGVA
jgi:hypothetical protein